VPLFLQILDSTIHFLKVSGGEIMLPEPQTQRLTKPKLSLKMNDELFRGAFKQF
jgi:hypothetical protein